LEAISDDGVKTELYEDSVISLQSSRRTEIANKSNEAEESVVLFPQLSSSSSIISSGRTFCTLRFDAANVTRSLASHLVNALDPLLAEVFFLHFSIYCLLFNSRYLLRYRIRLLLRCRYHIEFMISV
jgi:hypothetical protein